MFNLSRIVYSKNILNLSKSVLISSAAMSFDVQVPRCAHKLNLFTQHWDDLALWQRSSTEH